MVINYRWYVMRICLTAGIPATMRGMIGTMRHSLYAALIGALLLAGPYSAAQEQLDTILERGYVAHWLVCGPFDSDKEGGIAGALERGEPPLGDKDFMEPIKGVAQMRPQHLVKVRKEGGESIWQRAGTADYSLNLAPFFPDAAEGVAYAGFYAETPDARTVLMDVQSPLGVRVWMNGFPVRDVHGGPVTSMGTDCFTVAFRPGMNFFVCEVPGITFEALAKAANMSVNELGTRVFVNRPLLRGVSGFEMALKPYAALPLGEVFYVPRLENAGAFSGGANDVRQDAWLTLFNAGSKVSPPVDVIVIANDPVNPEVRRIAAIKPGEAWKERIPIPIGATPAGLTIPVKVRLASKDAEGGDVSAVFAWNLPVLQRVQGGTVYVVSGQRYAAESESDEAARMDARVASLHRQWMLMEQEATYGMDLGAAQEWQAALIAYPEYVKVLQQAGEHAGALAAYAMPDERLVGGEVIARNIVYGSVAARDWLNITRPSYCVWNMPGIAPQTPQLLDQAGLGGLISNVPVLGLPPLFRHSALNGVQIFHRRKQACPGPANVDELRQMAALQRRELLDWGIASDVLVLESAITPPEPFFMGASRELAQSYPAIRVQGSGGNVFMSDLARLDPESREHVPDSGRLLTTRCPGAVLAQPDLKRAHAITENRLLIAERFASIAALLGGDYPDVALDRAWRSIMYWSAPDRLGVAPSKEAYADTLSAYRESAELIDGVLRKSLAYVAREADTLKTAPISMEGVKALVVFNPSSWPRTDVCEAEVELDNAKGLALLDNFGNPVPFGADRVRYTDASKQAVRAARVRFVAQNIPAAGYRTFYIQPEGKPQEAVVRGDAQIENEFFLVALDAANGAIHKLLDKRTSIDYAKGPLNQLVLLEEDSTQTDSGRELWTIGKQTASTEKPDKVKSEILEGMQKLVVRSPFGGGTLTREITLYRGVPRVDCETRTEGVNLEGKMLVALFSVLSEQRVPVFGERFGAVAGRRSRSTFDFRSKGAENPSGTGVQPALDWVAVSPNDSIQIGSEGAVALGPCQIIYGKDPALKEAARDVMGALVRRGIPASMTSDAPNKPDFLWTDSTEFVNLDADLDHGAAMRIVIGGPAQNMLCDRLVKELPEAAAKQFLEHVPQGTALYFEDGRVPEGCAPVPTLILAGAAPDRSAAMASDFAESVGSRGHYDLPPSGYLPEKTPAKATNGFAVFFKGAKLCSLERDGTLAVGLAHGAAPENMQTFRYALCPFDGDWRDAAVVREARAYNELFLTSVSDLHTGHQPGLQGFLEINPPGWLMSTLKPAGYAMASMQANAAHPRNGLVMRGWEATGRPWKGNLQFFVPFTSASHSTLLEDPGKTLKGEDASISLESNGFDVDTVWMLPTTRFSHGERATLGPEADLFGPVHSRYWEHHLGTAPLGNMPLSLVLRGSLENAETKVEAVIANHLSDKTLEGIVYLQAADGWSVGPGQFYYNLKPGESKEEDISVAPPASGADTGGMVAWTTYKDQIIRDVLDRMNAPLAMTVSRNEAQVKVTIQNKCGIPAEGFVDLVVPAEFWPELGESPSITVLPRRAAVAVPPFQSQDVLFRFSDPAAAPWAMVKLAANGHALYQAVPE